MASLVHNGKFARFFVGSSGETEYSKRISYVQINSSKEKKVQILKSVTIVQRVMFYQTFSTIMFYTNKLFASFLRDIGSDSVH